MIGLIYVFARININPGKNDAILMAGFVRSDTDTTPLGIMMMAWRKPLGVRMKMKMAGFGTSVVQQTSELHDFEDLEELHKLQEEEN